MVNAADDRARMMADVCEACADALLAAVAAAMGGVEGQAGIDQAREHAIAIIDVVIARTRREGPKPR